jgi:glucosamine-6-phosphate deaminase
MPSSPGKTGSSLASRTRVKTLAQDTVLDNARFFGNDRSAVPRMALTVGVATVLESREVVVLITGRKKALALAKCVEEGVNHLVSFLVTPRVSLSFERERLIIYATRDRQCTVSAIQLHPWTMVVCDSQATAGKDLLLLFLYLPRPILKCPSRTPSENG